MKACENSVTTRFFWPEVSMNCMEVWGGNGTTENQFARPGLDVWVSSHSQGCAEAGGSDLYLLSSCASGRITRMLLADICGYGPLVADIAVQLRELMRQNVNSIKQSRVVREMSHRLADASRRGCFASTLVSTYFASTRTFTLCNAGHAPPLLFHGRTGEWSVLKQTPRNIPPGNSPLGVVSPGEYQQFTTKLEVGDMVLVYSNALTECRTAEGLLLGLEGLLSRLRALDPRHPTRLPVRLLSQIESEHAGNLAVDDATLLFCRVTEKQVAWRDNLLAPIRLLRKASDRTNIGTG